MSMNKIIIDGYLKAWGWFIRIDRTQRGYSAINWGDYVGSTPVQIEDVMLERTCEAMNRIKAERFDIYRVLRDFYVEDKTAKDIALDQGVNPAQVRNLKSEGYKMLRLMLLGCCIESERSNHWGEYPDDSKLAPPKKMVSA